MTCTVECREQLHEARRALVAFRECYGAALHAPAKGTYDRWTIEAALGPEVDGMGPELALVAFEHDLVTLEVCSRSPDETRVLLGRSSA
jgi:hypothetical protein